MNTTQQLNLIEGNFTNLEAKEILQNVFATKLKFHELKNFSSIERFGKEDPVAMVRIPQLKNELLRLNEIFEWAETHQKGMHLSSNIDIFFFDK